MYRTSPTEPIQNHIVVGDGSAGLGGGVTVSYPPMSYSRIAIIEPFTITTGQTQSLPSDLSGTYKAGRAVTR